MTKLKFLKMVIKEMTKKNRLKEESSWASKIRTNSPGYVGSDFASKADEDDLELMVELKDEYALIYNQLLPIQRRINLLRKKYGLRPESKELK